MPTHTAKHRLGIISDIHSNVDALHAVLDDFDRRQVDQIICLGDIIGIGAHPEDCLRLLRDQFAKGRIRSLVRGNHEEYLLDKLPYYNHNDRHNHPLPQAILDLFSWNHQQISDESINFLRQWPKQEVIKIGQLKLFVSHYPSNRLGKFMPFIMKPSLRECRQIFRHAHAKIYLFGHTHLRDLQIGRNGDFFINPGNVGCPIGTDSASAGILEIQGHRISYEQLDIDYNINQTIADMMHYNDELPAIKYTIDQFYHSDSA